MSGENEVSFLIQDSRQARRLRDRAVAERAERLFSVQISLPVPAAGSQDRGQCVTLTARGGGGDESTEKAKKYILSLCMPEAVQEWQAGSQTAELLLSDTNQLRDQLEREFQTVLLPSSSSSPSSPSGCVRVQGKESDVRSTIVKIADLMAPPQRDTSPPRHQLSPTPSQPPALWSPSSPQSSPSPPSTSTTETFSPSPPPPPTLTSTRDSEHRLRVSPHQLQNIPTLNEAPRDPHLLRVIVPDIELDGHVVPRSMDTSRREQTIQDFVRLNFPREKIETIINSIGWEADYDDILRRLTTLHVTAPPPPRPMANLNISRPRTFTGEPMLSSTAVLRQVVIDGSNVAMRHGNGRVFSCRGIQIAVQWFRERGHKQITVFVPHWRRESPRAEYPITDQEILNQLEVDGTLVFTPSRRIGNKRIVCYDDRFIVKLAFETNGVIVSNDNFRDLAEENEGWRKTIEHRLVMFTFVSDYFMVPEDPLGKHGPSLTQLLQMESTDPSVKGPSPDTPGPKVCPYAERCTFGKKCRYYHPEREGRQISSRSATSSPVPVERRHTGDVQKDSGGEHISPAMGPTGRRSKSPQKPHTSPSVSAQQAADLRNVSSQDPMPYQPELQGYVGVPQGYRKPQVLAIPNGSLSLQPLAPQQRSPRPSDPSTPYASHTFPIVNLPAGRPKNVTDKIQSCTSGSPVPALSDFGTARGGEDDSRSFRPRAPNAIVPPHPHGTEVPLGLLPRGDYGTPCPSMPPYASEVYPPYSRPSSYQPSQQQQHSYHYVHSHAYPPTSSTYYLPSEPPATHRLHHSPVKNGHALADYSGTPGVHVPPPPPQTTSVAYPGRQLPELTAFPEGHMYSKNHAYAASNVAAYPPPNERFSSRNPPLHPSNRGQSVPDYVPSHPQQEHRHYTPGMRSTSLYGEAMLRTQNAVEQNGVADRYQNSRSSPELHHVNHSCSASSLSSGSSSNVDWSLFKVAQVRLPNQEQRIMETMTRYPGLDLENLVQLVQRLS